jgi:DNA topoisomerase-1
LLAEKQNKGPGGRARGGTPAALKELGDHPDGGKITVRDGKYGPYVNWGKVNATLPKSKDPQTVTVEEALALIAEKAGKSGGIRTKAKASASKAKTAAADSKTTKATAKPKAKTAKAASASKKATSKKSAE